MTDEPTDTVAYCPYCDALKTGATKKAALRAVSDHVDSNHGELPNTIKEDLEDDEEFGN